MHNRRDFLKSVAGASMGAFLLGNGGQALAASTAIPSLHATPPQNATARNGNRRLVKVGGKRVKTVDAHCHVRVPEVADLLKGTPLEKAAAAEPGGPEVSLLGPNRIALMDREGIDVQAVSINPFWYAFTDRDLSEKFIDLQNQKLATMCAANPERFVAFASVALQFPDLAAQQLEQGMKKYQLRGASIGGSVNGEELSNPKYDPFWAKAEELQALVFMHPQADSANITGITKRAQGNGMLANVIGNPLETTFFLAHLIMEGTFDKFPNLKIMAAHGGGYLPSYVDRLDHGCLAFPQQCNVKLKKKPSEYMRQIYVDSLVFSPEALRHLVAVCGVSQIGIGTDYPFPWTTTPVDHILGTPGLSNADKTAILGGNMCRLLNIPA
jgi:predicted TIM-barrel fold metal-dependent hydrolase